MLVDAGTNTEVIIGNKDGLMAASCPAGPAFEGGPVTYGMPGCEGAIESLRRVDGRFQFKTIGDVEPRGICGSGLIDLLAELRRHDLMTPKGVFADKAQEFMIVPEHGITFSREDASHLAQAKAANYCGQIMLMRKFGITPSEITRLYLAGGFANYVDAVNAIEMGFLAPVEPDRIEKFGNAASRNHSFGWIAEEAVEIARAHVAKLIAADKYREVSLEYKVRGNLNSAAYEMLEQIVTELRHKQRTPNHQRELRDILDSRGGGISERVAVCDVFIGDFREGPLCIELKGPTPNLDTAAGAKRNMLYFLAIMHRSGHLNAKAFLGFYYNPWIERILYAHWTTKQIMDMDHEVLMGAELWDHIGGTGTFDEMIPILEKARKEVFGA
ncbi:MAG: TdeIII family type II restriction endonuclease, partial [Chloroflexi bacterium]|nr:TdeIII family type II restriction endonuclease [Chloroflexota bacterium]